MYVAKEDLETGEISMSSVEELKDSSMSSGKRESLMKTEFAGSYIDSRGGHRYHVAKYKSDLPDLT